jgi:hypothetical protein
MHPHRASVQIEGMSGIVSRASSRAERHWKNSTIGRSCGRRRVGALRAGPAATLCPPTGEIAGVSEPPKCSSRNAAIASADAMAAWCCALAILAAQGLLAARGAAPRRLPEPRPSGELGRAWRAADSMLTT